MDSIMCWNAIIALLYIMVAPSPVVPDTTYFQDVVTDAVEAAGLDKAWLLR